MVKFLSKFIKEDVDLANLTKLALKESKKNRIVKLARNNAEGLAYVGIAGTALGLFQDQNIESVLEGAKQAYLASIPFMILANTIHFQKYNDPIHRANVIDKSIHATEKPGTYLLTASIIDSGIFALSAWVAHLYNSQASIGFGAKVGLIYSVAETIEWILKGEDYKKKLR